jgi:hypothetical protein
VGLPEEEAEVRIGLTKLGRTGKNEPTRNKIMDMFGSEDDHGTGYFSVGQLRRALKGKPASAFIYICVDGKTRCPVVDVKFEENEAVAEGGTGEFVLFGDGAEGD